MKTTICFEDVVLIGSLSWSLPVRGESNPQQRRNVGAKHEHTEIPRGISKLCESLLYILT